MIKAIALVALALALEGGFILHSVVSAPVAPASRGAPLSHAVASLAR